jgi:hypothetical protein
VQEEMMPSYTLTGLAPSMAYSLQLRYKIKGREGRKQGMERRRKKGTKEKKEGKEYSFFVSSFLPSLASVTSCLSKMISFLS